jgi:hypothetical protein
MGSKSSRNYLILTIFLKFLQIIDTVNSKDPDPDPVGQLITNPPDPDLQTYFSTADFWLSLNATSYIAVHWEHGHFLEIIP